MHWIRRHRRGRPPHPDILTPAEWRVLEHIREGLPNAEIAVRLGVSVNTVRAQVSSILAKTGLPDRHALAAWDGRPAEASREVLGRGFALPFAGWWTSGAVKLTAGGFAAVVFLGAVLVAFATLVDADQEAADGFFSVPGGVSGMYLEAVVEFERTTWTQLLPYRPGSTTSPVTVRWWWTDDGRGRIEVEGVDSLLNQRAIIDISGPGEHVEYSGVSAAYASAPFSARPSEFPILPAALIGPSGSGPSLPRPPDAQIRRVGTAEILGRTVEVFEYPDPTGTRGVRVREWVDPSGDILLRAVQSDPTGRFFTYAAEVVQLESNLRLDPDLFRFQPAPDDIEADPGRNCGGGAAGLVEDGTLRRESPFLSPRYVPPGWQDGRWARSGLDAACPFARFWTILERHEDDGYIFFDQRRRGVDDVPEWLRTDTPVDVAGHEGYRLTQDGVEHLIWARDGVVSLLESDTLPFDELLRMAESAEPVR